MRKSITILIFLLPVMGLVSYGQDSPCLPLLKDGLYKYVMTTRTASFNGDLKSYFESATFKEDFKSGKWNLGVNGIIPVAETGLMSEIGLEFGSSEDKINQFQQSIKEAKSIQINERFYQSTVTAVPDVGLAKAYVECIRGVDKKGFIVKSVNETPNNVVFNIGYTKRLNADPMPTVKDFRIIGSTNILQGLKQGDKVTDQFSLSCERYPENGLILSINTDRENLVYVVEASDSGFGKEFPIGSVLTTVLDWNSFSQITEDKPSSEWDAKKSKWAPADGRSVASSKYQRKIGKNNVPDLRGVFLRGLNKFDPFESTSVADVQKDPEGETRVAGEFQPDIFKSHFHTTEKLTLGHKDHGYDPPAEDLDPGGWAGYKRLKTDSKGGLETRPKNVTVFYYVRIN